MFGKNQEKKKEYRYSDYRYSLNVDRLKTFEDFKEFITEGNVTFSIKLDERTLERLYNLGYIKRIEG